MFSALPQCADRDTKWIFSVDTFTSTKSTHWKNSNILATRPKVHNSILKVNPSGHTVALGLTQPVTEMCVMGVSWGLRQPLRQADTLLPSCIDCLEAAIRSYQGLYKEGFYWLFSHDNSSSYGNAICVCLLEPCSKRTYQFLQQLAFQLFLLICEIPAVGVFLVYGCSQLCSL